MKTKRILLLTAILCAGILSCDDDEKKIVDPIYEFISIDGDPVFSMSEIDNSTEAYPLVIRLWKFEPYTEDVQVNLGVTGTNAAEGVDYTVTPSESVKIKAGKLVSDTIWIKTIDNAVGNELPRSVEVKIASFSKPDIKIGLGITTPRNAAVVFNILDDECSGNPICVFNVELVNTIGGGAQHPAATVVDKINNKITLTGDLIDYDVFPAATLTLTLTPDAPGSKTGTATFGEQETGTDEGGYNYKFEEVGTGTYDADAGTISIEYDIYYSDAGGWAYWYTVTNVFSVP